MIMDNKYENIVPWNGVQDTGRDVRLKLERNFGRIGLNFEEVMAKFSDTDDLFILIAEELEKKLSKDKPDSTDHLTGFNVGITIARKEINGVIISTDADTDPSDTSVYTSLSVDTIITALEDKYIRKDKEDSTLYPVDFRLWRRMPISTPPCRPTRELRMN